MLHSWARGSTTTYYPDKGHVTSTYVAWLQHYQSKPCYMTPILCLQTLSLKLTSLFAILVLGHGLLHRIGKLEQGNHCPTFASHNIQSEPKMGDLKFAVRSHVQFASLRLRNLNVGNYKNPRNFDQEWHSQQYFSLEHEYTRQWSRKRSFVSPNPFTRHGHPQPTSSHTK